MADEPTAARLRSGHIVISLLRSLAKTRLHGANGDTRSSDYGYSRPSCLSGRWGSQARISDDFMQVSETERGANLVPGGLYLRLQTHRS